MAVGISWVTMIKFKLFFFTTIFNHKFKPSSTLQNWWHAKSNTHNPACLYLLNSLVLSSIQHSAELFFHAESLTIQLTWNDSWCITNIMTAYGKIVMVTSTDKLIIVCSHWECGQLLLNNFCCVHHVITNYISTWSPSNATGIRTKSASVGP